MTNRLMDGAVGWDTMTKVETAFYYSTQVRCLLQVHSLSGEHAMVRRWEQYSFDFPGEFSVPWSYGAMSCFMRTATSEARSVLWSPKLYEHDTMSLLCELIDCEYEKIIHDRYGSFLSLVDPRTCTFARSCCNRAVALVENLRPNSAGINQDRWVCDHHRSVAAKALGSDMNVVFEIHQLEDRK